MRGWPFSREMPVVQGEQAVGLDDLGHEKFLLGLEVAMFAELGQG